MIVYVVGKFEFIFGKSCFMVKIVLVYGVDLWNGDVVFVGEDDGVVG